MYVYIYIYTYVYIHTYIHTYICYGTHTVQNPTTSRERALHSESLQSDVKSREDGLQGPVTILGPSLMAWQIVDAETPHPLRCDANYQTDVKLLGNNSWLSDDQWESHAIGTVSRANPLPRQCSSSNTDCACGRMLAKLCRPTGPSRA